VMAEKGLDFRTTGYIVTGGTLAFRGVFQSDNRVSVASGVTTTLAALVTGSTGLTKSGAGTLAITGSATGLTGGIQIDAGTLQVGASGTVGSLNASTPITVASGGTLAFNRSDTYGGNIANVISGSGGLALLSGSLGLSGSHSYAGGTLVRGGTLALAATADSGLPVSYVVEGPATLANGVLTFTAEGTVAVTASQPGDEIYNPAAPVTITITVRAAPADPTEPTDPADPVGRVLLAAGGGLARLRRVAGIEPARPLAGVRW